MKRPPKSSATKPRRPRLQAIHKNIKRLREKRGMSLADLGRIIDVDRSAVLYWEAGRSAPIASRIPKVAIALGVTIDELYEERA